jgi:hypothetical protein
MIDAGPEGDRYTFLSTTGLGKADYSGWGLFVDEGGDDRYQLKEGLGHSSENGLGGFFDLKGQDTYDVPEVAASRADDRPSNGKVTVYPDGGLFVDR